MKNYSDGYTSLWLYSCEEQRTYLSSLMVEKKKKKLML